MTAVGFAGRVRVIRQGARTASSPSRFTRNSSESFIASHHDRLLSVILNCEAHGLLLHGSTETLDASLEDHVERPFGGPPYFRKSGAPDYFR